jgi:hypothetical protein
MPTTEVAGAGPIVFFTQAGTQITLPLSAVYFDASDQVKVRRADDGDTPQLTKWLEYLVDQKRITRAVTPPRTLPGPSMVVTARVAGADGNRITVRVATNAADTTKLDVTVTEADVYEGLSLDVTAATSIDKVLGLTGGAAGTRASLVRVDAITGTPPLPNLGAVAITSTSAGIPSWTVQGGNPAVTSFILSARATGSEGAGALWTVEVAEITATAFTLEVSWTKTVTIAAVADLAGLDAALGFAVAVARPEGALAFTDLPAPGTFTLQGGAGSVAARPASATVPARA